jgi:hypothetical protein
MENVGNTTSMMRAIAALFMAILLEDAFTGDFGWYEVLVMIPVIVAAFVTNAFGALQQKAQEK